MDRIEKLNFLSIAQVRDIAEKYQTPVFVYFQKVLEDKALAFPNEYGLTVRYAMKANSNVNILRIFDKKGIHIDASSEYEVERAALAGINPENILLTSQQFPVNLPYMINKGVQFNACSLDQLERFGEMFPDNLVSVRINPGLGSGGTNKTNTGGPGSSFGIWHEQFGEVLKIADEHGLKIWRVHTHIGSGSDPEVWKKVAGMSLGIVERFIKAGHDVQILNLGGGYKVARMNYEESTGLQECGEPVRQAFIDFEKRVGRQLKLEIEPGTFLTANAGSLIARVIDVKTTPDYNFIVIDSGMVDITRPSLYGAEHPIVVVPEIDQERRLGEYVVVGNCCESGDLLTPKPGDSETLDTRILCEAQIGDFVVIGGAGSYCSSMNVEGYNSYPGAAEILLDNEGKSHLIKKRQSLEQLMQNEKVVIKNN